MNHETLFSLVNMIVLPQWLLMIVAPRWKGTQWLTRSFIIPLLLSVAYIAFLFMAGGVDFQAFSQLNTLQVLFEDPVLVLGGWVHYLAFDLVVGSWILWDSQTKGINHLLIVPCLLLCFLMGPVGFLLYQLISRITQKK